MCEMSGVHVQRVTAGTNGIRARLVSLHESARRGLWISDAHTHRTLEPGPHTMARAGSQKDEADVSDRRHIFGVSTP
jgi:hypothetical protein